MRGPVRQAIRRVWPSWPRVPLSPGFTTALAAAALFAAAASGLDYIALPNPSLALTAMERAAPLDVWGVLLLIASLSAVIGWLARRWTVVILAHMTLSGCYAAFGVSALVGTITPWAGNGWRTGIGWLCLQGVVHFVLASAAWLELDKHNRRRPPPAVTA